MVTSFFYFKKAGINTNWDGDNTSGAFKKLSRLPKDVEYWHEQLKLNFTVEDSIYLTLRKKKRNI